MRSTRDYIIDTIIETQSRILDDLSFKIAECGGYSICTASDLRKGDLVAFVDIESNKYNVDSGTIELQYRPSFFKVVYSGILEDYPENAERVSVILENLEMPGVHSMIKLIPNKSVIKVYSKKQ